MLERAKEIIADIAAKTDSIILMHSLSGKDSIALLDLVAPHFKRIVCVYMYVVPDLDHIAPFQRYAAKKYPNTVWLQVPHYGYYSWVKYGFMGVERNPNQRLWKLADIIDKVRERTGVEWACLGFKQSDSLNRRLMLRSYKDGKESISWKGKKFYPLSTYKNGDVLEYISSVSYPNSKARHLVEMARTLMEKFGGEVPEDMDQLLPAGQLSRRPPPHIHPFPKDTIHNQGI